MQPPTEIIGVDPGLAWPAFAALDPKTERLLRVSSFDGTKSRTTLNKSVRVHGLVEIMMKEIVKVPGTKVVGIEGPARNRGFQAIDALGRFRQGIFAACTYYLEDWEHFEIPPASVKRALTGNGAAPKEQMVQMAVSQFRVTLSAKKDCRFAEADAIGIAVAALGRWKRGSIDAFA